MEERPFKVKRNCYFLNKMKEILKNIIPPILLKSYHRLNPFWKGNFINWSEANKYSSGYSCENILLKVEEANKKVLKGEFPYERDSVNFPKIEYSWPLLSGLLMEAASNGGNLNVLDFGGSLGSTYFQNKLFLKYLNNLKWNVIEQNNFVESGKKNFQNENLKFYYNIEECLSENKVNLLLFSSVLQYIEEPYKLLKKSLDFGINTVILDRLSIIEHDHDWLTVQHVPKKIYKASYPCWFFNKENILSIFKNQYNLICEFDAFVRNETFVDGRIPASDKGFIFRLK